MMRRRDAGITLVEATAAITLVGIVLALLVPAFSHSSRIDDVMTCRAHLKTLYDAQVKAPAPGPKEFGRAYWLRLAQSSPPLVTADALRCPFVVAPDAPPCHYYGPAEEVSKRADKDPIGCDMEHNHGEDGKKGGNILLKSGEVKTDHTGIWGTAIRSGKCRP
jgi:hypothetical protein